MGGAVHPARSRGLTRRGAVALAAGLAAGQAAGVGCGPFRAPGATPGAKEPVTLRLVWNGGDAEHTMAVRGPVFEQLFPHVKLQFEPTSEYAAKITVLFSTNSIGDVMYFSSDGPHFFGFWSAQGVLNQLDPYVKRDKVDTSVFFPAALEALKIVDGKLWTFPYKAFVVRSGLYYNASLFQQAGLPLPTDDWTYDDVRQATQRLTRRAGGDGEVWGGTRLFAGEHAFMAATRAFGGDLYSKDGTKTLLASEPSRQAISWWLDRCTKDRTVALDPGPPEPRVLFEQGKGALYMGDNPGRRQRIANALNPAGVPWGLTLMPKGPAGRRGGALHSVPTGMAKITKHPDEAWEFQKFLADKETGVVMGFPPAQSPQILVDFGARKDVYQDPRVLNAPDMPPGVMAAVVRSMELPEPFSSPANFQSGEVTAVLNGEVVKAVRGEVPYDSGFFQNLASRVQLVLDKPAPRA